jgi:hypothetical protein
MALDDDDALAIGLALLALVTLGNWSLKNALTPSLPRDARLPDQGELRQRPAVRTALDPAGFPELFNKALQIHASAEGEVAQLLRNWAALSPSVPAEVDPDYDTPAKLFAAQAAVETDSGRATWNFNVGNLTTSKGDYFKLPNDPRKYSVFLYPLQAAVAMIDRVKRLWPDAYKIAMGGGLAYSLPYSEALIKGGKRYFDPTTPEMYAAGLRGRAKRHGWTK